MILTTSTSPSQKGCIRWKALSLIPTIIEHIKLKKINIGTKVEPKFASIGDYWDDETIGHIVDLLHEYQDIFPTKFTEMKGIIGDLEVMYIPLKADTKPMK